MTRQTEATGVLDWQAVEAEASKVLRPIVDRFAKEATDLLYGQMLEATQDYFAENIRFNIASRLEAAHRGWKSEWDRAEAAEAEVKRLGYEVARWARFQTSGEWGKPISLDEAVAAMDREIVRARTTLANTPGTILSAVEATREPKDQPTRKGE